MPLHLSGEAHSRMTGMFSLSPLVLSAQVTGLDLVGLHTAPTR